jgi:hypothetical protein
MVVAIAGAGLSFLLRGGTQRPSFLAPLVYLLPTMALRSLLVPAPLQIDAAAAGA